MELEKHEREHLELLYPHLGECTLFLKRDDAFPLDKPCSIAAYGNGVRHTIKGGTGSGEVNSRFFINIEEGLKQTGFTIASSSWLDEFEETCKNYRKTWVKELRKEARKAHVFAPFYCMGRVMPIPEHEIELGEKADAAIYVVSRISGEGNDRQPVKGDVLLSDSEIRDILKLNEMYEKFMLVINAGGVVDLSPVIEVKNILILSELGSETGKALGDILLGKLNPSGKLTATWAKLEDYPYSMIIDPDESYYTEGLYVGYRYFDSFKKKPLFPFGFGLSYSSFKIDNYSISNNKSEIKVKADVTNISKYAGQEVVQLYLSFNGDSVYQQLAGFTKTPLLKEKEKTTVEVSFKMEELSKYDESRGIYYLPEGEYLLRLGNSSDNTVVVGSVLLKEEITTKVVRNMFQKIELEELSATVKKEKISKDVPQICLTSNDFVTVHMEERWVEFPEVVKRLSNKQLATLNVGYYCDDGLLSVVGESCHSVPGGAGETPMLYKHLFGKTLAMADGPAGLRVAKEYTIDKKGNKKVVTRNNLVYDAMEFLPKFVASFLKVFVVKDKKPKKNQTIYYQYCTALPIGTAIAQSWNKDFARLCGDIVGREMEIYDVGLWLAPALNIHKNILCGRNFEYFSEDPILSGIFASELTLGVQSHKGKGVTIKHFAANNQETNRTVNNSVVKERTLREIYLRGFEYCINHAQPKALMSSYNLINGQHTSENRQLINDFLFEENDFKGIVMTDWVISVMKNKHDKYPYPQANRVALTGTSFFMPGSKQDVKDMYNDLKNNKDLRKQVKINVSRVLRIIDQE